MSSVQFVSPRLRLSALLRKPGGPPLEEALVAAQANLKELAPDCRSELVTRLQSAEAALAALREFDDARLGQIYDAAVAGIGLGELSGTSALDIALTSLCDLVDELRSRRLLDAQAIAVHLRAWRLLLDHEFGVEAVREMLDGLLKVSARFATT